MTTCTMPNPDVSTELGNLRSSLHGLEAAGPTGFEGLLRNLIEVVTTQRFLLAKSGPQGGTDMRSQAANTLQVGLESKRYADSTRLGLDDLKAKLLDAATQPEPVDVWVLAASREITDTDTRALVTLGEQYGVAVVVLDWTESPVALPRMAVLCAAAPRLCADFLGNPAGLEDGLELIASRDDFADELKRLESELSNPDIGYASAAIAMRRWMRDAQSSELNARARLQGPNNLTQAGVVLVRRPAIFEALDSWWKNAAAPAGALVGQEGNGKTWASLAWSQGLGYETAIAMFIPARSVSGKQLTQVIAETLSERTGLRSPDFWRKRLKLWASAVRSAPPILVILDGIDQNWTCNWVDTIQPLLDPANAGLFRVLLTSRPDPWADLGGLVSLLPNPQKVDVPRLTDPELDDLLSQAGLMRSDFVPAVVELMRTPRLSLLAITQRDALAASGDVTAERLIYEDWKHRLGRWRDASYFSDAAFQKFIQVIGKDLRDSGETFTVTRRELLDRLSGDSGKTETNLRTVLSEIVDGRWLVKDPHNEHKFRVEKTLAPFALGLALAGDLRGILTEAEVESRISDYLDPLKGQSLALSVLRAATTLVLLDPRVERQARQGILDRWVSEQNFGRNDFDALWRMAGLDLDLFCDFTEQTWLTPRGGMFTDEILIKSMANAYEFPDVAPKLQARITNWLGWAWPDPFDGMFISQYDLTTPESLAKQALTCNNLAIWRHRTAGMTWPTIELKETGSVSWFSHRVFGIMSYLPRAQFADALIAWALSRSIMDFPRHFEELAWLLRVNRKDPSETRAAVFGAAIKLRNEASKIARRAAGWLLDALGDPEADALAAEIRTELAQEFGEKFYSAQRRHIYDGYGPIAPDETITWAPANDKAPDGRKLWLYSHSQGHDDVILDMATTKIARADPQVFRQIFIDTLASAEGRNDSELHGLTRAVRQFLFLLTTGERTSLQRILTARAQAIADSELKTILEGTGQFIALWSRPSADQISIITAALPNGLVGASSDVFNPIAAADWPGLRILIDNATDLTSLRIWMQYLLRCATVIQVKDWPNLAQLVLHADDIVRQCALKLAFNSRNGGALEAWAKSDWSVQDQAPQNDLVIYGSLALVAAQTERGCVVAADRMSPEAVAFALTERPGDIRRLDAFEVFFKAQMEESCRPGARAIPQYWNSHIDALRILFTARNNTVIAWSEQWLDAHPDLWHPALLDDFPVITLCKVLLDVQPALGVRLWSTLCKKMDENVFRRGDFCHLPLQANDSLEVNVARTEALTELYTDMLLFEFTVNAQRFGRTDWLFAEIHRRAALPNPFERALAYQLSGYIDYSAEADALWAGLAKPPQTACWLNEVHAAARRSYDRSRFAHHWHRQFIEEANPVKAFAALELFYACVDGRTQIWAKRELNEHRDRLGAEKLAHWWTNVARLNEAAKKDRDAKKSLLFGASIMDQTQAPWR